MSPAVSGVSDVEESRVQEPIASSETPEEQLAVEDERSPDSPAGQNTETEKDILALTNSDTLAPGQTVDSRDTDINVTERPRRQTRVTTRLTYDSLGNPSSVAVNTYRVIPTEVKGQNDTMFPIKRYTSTIYMWMGKKRCNCL